MKHNQQDNECSEYRSEPTVPPPCLFVKDGAVRGGIVSHWIAATRRLVMNERTWGREGQHKLAWLSVWLLPILMIVIIISILPLCLPSCTNKWQSSASKLIDLNWILSRKIVKHDIQNRTCSKYSHVLYRICAVMSLIYHMWLYILAFVDGALQYLRARKQVPIVLQSS